MLTTTTPGQNWRQWAFFALLFVPIFGLMFVLGVLIGRTSSPVFPIVLTAAIIGTIGAIIVLGLDFRMGIYLIMLLVLWDRMQTFGQGGRISGTKIAIAITIVFFTAAILADQVRGWSRKLGDPLIILGVLYLVVSLIGLPFMPHWEIGLDFVNRRTNVVALMAILILAVSDREVFHRCVLCIVISGTLVAFATLSEVATGKSMLERLGKSDPEAQVNVLGTFEGALRIVGPSGGSTFHALAQTLPGTLAFGLLMYYREWWKKALLTVSLLVIAFNIVGTGSRGGTLGFVVAALIVFLAGPVRHRFAKLALVAVFAVVALAVLAASNLDVAAQRVASPGTATRTIEYRVAMWQMALNMFLDHPVVGVGTNGWGIYYNIYREPGAPGSYLRVHNAFMQLLAENGLQGVLVYLGLYLAAAVSAFCAAFATIDRRLKFEATAVASTTFGFFFFAGTSNVLENELYFIVFGLCGAAYHVYRREQRIGEIPEHDRMLPTLVQMRAYGPAAALEPKLAAGSA